MIAYLNELPLFIAVGIVLLVITFMCIFFMVKSYRAGITIGMDQTNLKRAITSSVTFSALPSISILLGVIALSGSLGIPLSWLRLSVIGSLQYELNVADIASRAYGLTGLRAAEMTPSAFVTIGLVMTSGIILGIVVSIFLLKKYLAKVQGGTKKEKKAGPNTNDVLMIAMFIGLCAAYFGAYVGDFVHNGAFLPITTALISGIIILGFEYLINKKGMAWLENFSIAASMLIAMACAVLINMMMGGH